MAVNGFDIINQAKVGASQLHGPGVNHELWLASVQNYICSPSVIIALGLYILIPLTKNLCQWVEWLL